MTRQLRIGFDVGGIFTDGVLMEEREVWPKAKALTTQDVTGCLTWELGRRVFVARRKHLDPIKEITDLTGGYRVFQGKIIDINREFGAEKTKGFSLGQIAMEGIETFKGRTATLNFQNEWLVLEIDGAVCCLPPDLICILDPATGEPIRTDIVRYGYRGTVVLIPAHERMRTELGIKTFGPRYFGYDHDYVPVEQLIDTASA